MDEPAPCTELFRDLADTAVRRLPLYRRLCSAAAGDVEVADRLLLSPDPTQRVPTLLLAAVHDVVLAGDDHPDVVALSQWYGSVTEPPRPVGRGIDDPWPYFRRLALRHEGVAEHLRTGSTQTNEVGRCATLLPALATVAEEGHQLGLVEVGASAGLNLLLDHYGYRYTGPSPASDPSGNGSDPHHDGVEPGAVAADGSVWVAPDAALVLTCELRGRHRPPIPADVPTIVSRTGLDRYPVDVSDPDQARWLVACQWPDQPERIRRARAALALSHRRRPDIVEGDAVDDLAPLVEAVPSSALPVVVSTWMVSYLSPARQGEFVAVLDRLAVRRDLSLVFAEQPVIVPGLAGAGVLPARPDGLPDSAATALVRVDWRGGRRSAHRLADQHPHGTWLEWLAGP